MEEKPALPLIYVMNWLPMRGLIEFYCTCLEDGLFLKHTIRDDMVSFTFVELTQKF